MGRPKGLSCVGSVGLWKVDTYVLKVHDITERM